VSSRVCACSADTSSSRSLAYRFRIADRRGPHAHSPTPHEQGPTKGGEVYKSAPPPSITRRNRCAPALNAISSDLCPGGPALSAVCAPGVRNATSLHRGTRVPPANGGARGFFPQFPQLPVYASSSTRALPANRPVRGGPKVPVTTCNRRRPPSTSPRCRRICPGDLAQAFPTPGPRRPGL
jgi:hypothetical protein